MKLIRPLFMKTDNTHDRKEYQTLFEEILDNLTGEQKEVLRFICKLKDEHAQFVDRLSNHYHSEHNPISLDDVLNWFKRKMHPSRHDTFNEIYPLILPVLSAKEKIGYAKGFIRKCAINEILNDLEDLDTTC